MIKVDKAPGVRLVTDPVPQTLDVQAICEAIEDAAADVQAAMDTEAEADWCLRRPHLIDEARSMEAAARTLRRAAVATVARALAPYAWALRSLGGPS